MARLSIFERPWSISVRLNPPTELARAPTFGACQRPSGPALTRPAALFAEHNAESSATTEERHQYLAAWPEEDTFRWADPRHLVRVLPRDPPLPELCHSESSNSDCAVGNPLNSSYAVVPPHATVRTEFDREEFIALKRRAELEDQIVE